MSESKKAEMAAAAVPTVLTVIAIADAALTILDRIAAWKAAARERGELTAEAEAALDAKLTAMFAGKPWQKK